MNSPLRLLALSVLLLPLDARAVECDSKPHDKGGFEKTINACNKGGDADTCVARLIPVLIDCQYRLNDDQKKGIAADAKDVQSRIDALMDYAKNNPGIRKASLQQYGKPDDALVQLGLQEPEKDATDKKPTNTNDPEENTANAGTPKGQRNPATAAATRDLNSGNPAGAEKTLNKALEQYPNDAKALELRAEAREAQGNHAGALADARKALALDPSNKSAQRIATQNANLERADGTAKKFQKLADGMLHGPSDDSAAGGKFTAMTNMAGSGAGQSAPTAPGSLPASALASGAAGPAEKFTTLRSPSGFAPLVMRALEKIRVGDLTGALLDATQATDADPKDAAAWTVRAEIDNRLENYAAAIADTTRALALAPDNARALRARAFAELESGQLDAALADATKAVALDPQSGVGFLYKAMAEERLGKAEDAARDLKQAVALDPALSPLAAPLMKKLGLSAAPPSPRLSPHLLRGGLIVFSLSLVLFGLLGTRKGRALTARFTPRRAGEWTAEAPPVPALEAGTLLGGTYRIVREIGRGGMGVVYEGHDETLQRRVAVKRLLQDDQTTNEDLDRFLREARLVAQLKHPNVAEIYTVLPGREPFLIFEYVDGKTLDEVLRANRVLTLAAARKVVREVASALSSAHARGIIHRDLKPSNVMLTADGSVKVMDFGIAHQARSAATQMTRTIACGTPPYMAPEQGMGSVSKASDLYALGVMAYELVTGIRPFEGPDFLEQKLQRRYEPASRRTAAAPAALDALFASVFDPDPTRRPADAAAFADAFDRACDATPRRQASSV